MKSMKTWMLGLAVLGLVFSLAYAAGDVEQGKTLFNDPKLGDSANDASCNSCHPDGKGLAGVAEKPGESEDALVGVVNRCVKMALKGKELPPDSQEMKDIIAYMKSLK